MKRVCFICRSQYTNPVTLVSTQVVSPSTPNGFKHASCRKSSVSLIPGSIPIRQTFLNMSDDEPLDTEEDRRLLSSYNSRSHGGTGRGPRYHDRIGDQDIELGSISSASIEIESRNAQTVGEISNTGALDSLYSQNARPKKSATSIFNTLSRWAKGPRPSRQFKIKAILPRFQHIPIAFLDTHFPGRKQRSSLLLAICVLWITVFSAILSSSISSCRISGHRIPIRLSCVSRLW